MTLVKNTATIGASVIALGLTVGLAAGCASNAGDEIALVGYSVPAAGNEAVGDAFTHTDAGKGASFSTSYGASGDQSRAVEGGQKADIVHFSIDPDVTRLVDAGLVDENWNSGPDHGELTDSVVVLMVREGNPKGIKDWEDLTRPDVGIVAPNPGSSGSARWNILAAWGSQLQAGRSEQEAQDYVSKLVGNVKAFPSSGRDATTAFLDGTGDVLLSYENEAILAKQNGEKLDYIVPSRDLLIENPAAVTKTANESAKKFLDYARSPEGQQEYVAKGFRPLPSAADEVDTSTVEGVADPADPFPKVDNLYTIDKDYGGWKAVVDKFFDKDGIITGIINTSGLAG